MGPSLIGAGFSSGEFIQKIMDSEYPGLPKIMFGMVDVREVAEAHLQGLKRKEAANKRFTLVNTSLWFKDIAQTLHDEFHPQGYNFSTTELKYCLLSVASWFMPEAKLVLKSWGMETTFDHT